MYDATKVNVFLFLCNRLLHHSLVSFFSWLVLLLFQNLFSLFWICSLLNQITVFNLHNYKVGVKWAFLCFRGLFSRIKWAIYNKSIEN